MPRQRRRKRPPSRLARVLAEEGRRRDWLAARLSEVLGRNVRADQVSRWVHEVHVPEQATRAAIAEILGREPGECFDIDDVEAAA